MSGASCAALGSSIAASIHRISSLYLAARHACCRLLMTEMYASDRLVYLPTMAMLHTRLNVSQLCARSSHEDRSIEAGGGRPSVFSKLFSISCEVARA